MAERHKATVTDRLDSLYEFDREPVTAGMIIWFITAPFRMGKKQS